MLNDIFPSWIKNLKKSDLQQALQTTTKSDIISFSLGRPANELLALPQIQGGFDQFCSHENLQYSPPCLELKKHIVEIMEEKGVKCSPEEIFLTTGAQQAMTLLTKLFITEKDGILVDQLTYPGFIQVAQAAHAELIPAPLSSPKDLEKKLKGILEHDSKPKMIYTMPEGHNPLGISLSNQQRLDLTKIASSYQIPIIEDDAYGLLNYETIEPSLKSFWKEGVCYIGSFSKILAPSMRVGWIVTSTSVIEKLEILKEGLDINTSTLGQKLISSLFKSGHMSTHISMLRKEYKEKRDIMVESLRKYIPEMEFISPHSGFFIWGRLPSLINTDILFNLALEENVSFLPGSAFLIGNEQSALQSLRLSFGFCPKEFIEVGIKRLAISINRYIQDNKNQYREAV